MELNELYGMFLHGEDLASMGATEAQQALIKTFELYNNTKQLKTDTSNLAIVKKRYDAGIEFCGLSPSARAQIHARDTVIQAIEQGKSCRVAALEAGVSKQWALDKLHDNGYQFNFVLKKWRNGERYITRTFKIDGVYKNTSEEETAKVDKLVTLILSGYSLNQACIMADIDKGRARTRLFMRGLFTRIRNGLNIKCDPPASMI